MVGKLDFTDSQRASLSYLCHRIAADDQRVPLGQLRTERKKRQEAERRVELEAVLKNQRQQWVFRCKSNSAQAIKRRPRP